MVKNHFWISIAKFAKLNSVQRLEGIAVDLVQIGPDGEEGPCQRPRRAGVKNEPREEEEEEDGAEAGEEAGQVERLIRRLEDSNNTQVGECPSRAMR